MATSEKNYLQLLRFDKKLRENVIGKYLTNIRIVSLVLIVILIAGLTSLFSLPRRLNPQVEIPIIIVSTSLPGAGPEEAESLITIPLEERITSVDGISTLTSTSSNNSSVISIEFDSRVSIDDALDETQKAVDTVADLPKDATTPQVQDIDFEDTTVYTFAVTSKHDSASLMTFSERLRDSLEKLNRVDTVTLSGFEDHEIYIEIKPETASQFNASLQTISQSISEALTSFPAGVIRSNTTAYTVTIDPQITTISDIRTLQISLADTTLQLGDIATIEERPSDTVRHAYIATTYQPQQAVIFSVYKTSNADITEAVEEVKTHTQTEMENELGRYEITEIVNYADLITTQFNDLSFNFVITIFLVFIVLLLILGIRQALIAALTIPLSFFMAFFVMRITDISINFLSLFSLLLALGLLVDNAIVILSAITSYYRSKRFTAEEAGLLVYRDFISPIWTTTLTTVWAFLPLLLATGIIGEFIKTIPIVVSTILISSALIALFITIPIMTVFLNPRLPKRVIVLLILLLILTMVGIGAIIIPQSAIFFPTFIVYILTLFILYKLHRPLLNKVSFTKRFPRVFQGIKRVSNDGLLQFKFVTDRYEYALDRILHSKITRRKTILAVVIFSIFSYLLVPLGFVKNEFFPAGEGNQLFVSVEPPPGMNTEILEKEALRLASIIQEDPDIEVVSVQVGGGQQSAFEIGGGAISLTAKLVSQEERTRSSSEIAEDIRSAFSTYSQGELSVIEESGGPPVGNDVVVTLLGDELTTLTELANDVQSYMEQQEGITNIEQSIKPGPSKIAFIPDTKKLADSGIPTSLVGLTLRSYISGLAVDDLKYQGTSTPIQLQIGEDTKTPDELGQLTLTSPTGTAMPLIALGEFTLRQNPTQINRQDQKRTISVTASVLPGYNIPEKNADIFEHVETLDFPGGYSIKSGGVNEENARSINSILQAMIVSAVLILITLVIQLGSFRKAIIVMLVIPLAVSGVFIIFALFGIPLSFPALIGLLALFGIVVNNSIIMLHTINQNLSMGLSFSKSIIDGASSRLEPIFLSSLTTIIGLVPITLSDPLWQGLGGAIIAGLLFSGTIMLFFIPVVYYLIFAGEYKNVSVHATG